MSDKPVWMETWRVRQDGMNKDRGVASEIEPCVLVKLMAGAKR